MTASKVAYQFLAGIASNTAAAVSADSPSSSTNGGTSPSFQQPAWFKNLVAAGAKPSSSGDIGDEDIAHNLSADIQR